MFYTCNSHSYSRHSHLFETVCVRVCVCVFAVGNIEHFSTTFTQWHVFHFKSNQIIIVVVVSVSVSVAKCKFPNGKCHALAQYAANVSNEILSCFANPISFSFDLFD